EQHAEGAHPFAIRLIQADGAVVRNNRVRVLDGAAPLAAAVELIASRGVTLEDNQLDGLAGVVHADGASDYRQSGNRLRPCAARGMRLMAPAEEALGAPERATIGCR